MKAQPSTPLHPGLRFVPVALPDVPAVLLDWERISATHPDSIAGVVLREKQQVELLEGWDRFYREQPFGEVRRPGLRYGFENGAYSYSDALFYHFVIRQFEPARIVEIGSGHSTCIAMDTADRFLRGAVKLSFIEPYPELLKSLLLPGDLERIELLPIRLQDAPLELFSGLRANDILFVDSTHFAKIGNDVNRILFDMLPPLRPGILIHFHGVFWLVEYPREWIEEGRAWNEAYLFRAFLQFNEQFEIVVFNTLLEMRHRRLFEARLPLCIENPGGSIWLRRRT